MIAKISVSESIDLPAMDWAIDLTGCSAVRRKGFIFFSVAIVLGTVGRLFFLFRSHSSLNLISSWLSGSIVRAKRKLLSVYSWVQKTLVVSGSAESF